MKKNRYSGPARLGLFVAAAALAGTSLSAQTSLPRDPRDPLAYRHMEHRKQSSNAKALLSTVHYVAASTTLVPLDSTWTTYDAAGQRVTELITFHWHDGRWFPFDRFKYSYNGTFNHQTLYEFWSINQNGFTPMVRYNYLQDGQGNRTHLLYEIWDLKNGVYADGLRESYTYDASGLQTGIHREIWSAANTVWVNNSIESFAYTSTGKQQAYEIQGWDPGSSAWVPKRRTVTSYTPSGAAVLREDESTWDQMSSSWVAKSRRINAVSGNEVMRREFESYDVPKSQWVQVHLESMAYQPDGLLSRTTFATWYAAGSTYQDALRSTHTYTSTKQPKRVATLALIHGKWQIDEGAAETIFYYKDEQDEPLSAGSPAAPSFDLLLSPIPAVHTLNVTVGRPGTGPCRFQIVDMSGRMVSNGNIVQPQSQVDVSGLPDGFYSLRVAAEGQATESRSFTISR